MKLKKILAFSLSAAMVFSSTFSAFAESADENTDTDVTPISETTVPADTKDHWAEDAMVRAFDNGILVGNGEGFNPDGQLTRAELGAFLSRAFNASVKADTSSYTDIDADAWYAAEIAKALQMKTLVGSNNLMRPTDKITREEVFSSFARTIGLTAGTKDDLAAFTDAADVSDWAVGMVAAMVKAGYVSGFDGKISPKAVMTRAEFATILDKAIAAFVTEEGTYEADLEGTLMINVPGVTVTGKINGNVILGDGVGTGDVIFDAVKITGNVIVRGGGENSVEFINGTSVDGNVLVNNMNSVTRLFADSADIKFAAVDAVTAVIIDGVTVGTITVSGDTVVVSGKVDKLIVADGTKTVIVEKGASVGEIEANAEGAKISGEGKIGTVTVNANDVAVDNTSAKVTVAEDVTGTTVNGKDVAGGESGGNTTPTPPSGGGEGGGSEEVVYSVDVDAAPLVDHVPPAPSSSAPPTPTPITVEGLKATGSRASSSDINRVTVSSTGIVPGHFNGVGTFGYWVGVGIPAPAGVTDEMIESKATALAGWGAVPSKFEGATALKDFDAVKDGFYKVGDKTYYSFYFGLTTKTDAYIVIDWDGPTVAAEGETPASGTMAPVKYKIDFSGVKYGASSVDELTKAYTNANAAVLAKDITLSEAFAIDKAFLLYGQNNKLSGNVNVTMPGTGDVTIKNCVLDKSMKLDAKQGTGKLTIDGNKFLLDSADDYATNGNPYIVLFETDDSSFDIAFTNNIINDAVQTAPNGTIAFLMNKAASDNKAPEGSKFAFTGNTVRLNALHAIYNIKAAEFTVNGNTFICGDKTATGSPNMATALTAYNGGMHGKTTVTNNSFTGYDYAIKLTQYDADPVGTIAESNTVDQDSKLFNAYYAMKFVGLKAALAADLDVVRVLGEGNVFTVSENLEVPAGAKLEVPSNKTLKIGEGVTLTVNGTLENNGKIENNGTIDGTGSIENKAITDVAQATFSADSENKENVNEMMVAFWTTGEKTVQGITFTAPIFSYNKDTNTLTVDKAAVTDGIKQWITTQWGGTSVPVAVTLDATKAVVPVDANWSGANLVWIDLSTVTDTTTVNIGGGLHAGLNVVVK